MFSPFTRDRVNETQKVFFFKLIDYFYFWLHWVFLVVQGLSLVSASRGHSPLTCTGFSLRWSLDPWASVVAARGLSIWGARVLGHLDFSS